jgi:hypothetical protein
VAGRKRGNGEGSKPRKRLDGRCEAPYYDAAGQRKTVYGNSHKEVAGQLTQGLTTKDDIAEF